MKKAKIHSDDGKEDYFETSDLGCASALVSAGNDIVEVDKSQPARVMFSFKNTEKIQKSANDYFNSKLKVGAKQMYDNIKMLKVRIFN